MQPARYYTSGASGPVGDNRFAGYTEDEKFHIAHDYLFEKQRVIHGIPAGVVELTDEGFGKLSGVIQREAGVRNLEREVATLFRKTAKKIAEIDLKDRKKYKIGPDGLQTYLGPTKFTSSLAEKKMRLACRPDWPGPRRAGIYCLSK